VEALLLPKAIAPLILQLEHCDRTSPAFFQTQALFVLSKRDRKNTSGESKNCSCVKQNGFRLHKNCFGVQENCFGVRKTVSGFTKTVLEFRKTVLEFANSTSELAFTLRTFGKSQRSVRKAITAIAKSTELPETLHPSFKFTCVFCLGLTVVAAAIAGDKKCYCDLTIRAQLHRLSTAGALRLPKAIAFSMQPQTQLRRDREDVETPTKFAF
jgi:hypothetical protein